MNKDLALPAIKPAEVSKKIESFIKKTFKEAGKTQAVVAVSGGVDSATTLYLTVNALGPENVHVLLLPSLQSSTKNTDDGAALAEDLGIPLNQIHEINIAGIQQITDQTMKLYTSNSEHISDERKGNFAARIRMSVIFDQAKVLDALVVGTENKSEHLLGYFTRFGDAASDIEPIQHLYKTQVIALAAYLKVPQPIVEKTPSANLWADQTDEGELGFSYIAADPVLYNHFEKGKSQTELVDMGYETSLVEKVLAHCEKVAFKLQVPYQL